MASITLNWTPAGGPNSTGQQVQRKTIGGTFATIANLNADVATYVDNTAADGILYVYQILNICSSGGQTDSLDVQAIKFVCPSVNVQVIGVEANFVLPPLTGSASYLSFQVFDTNNVSVFSTSLAGQTAQNIDVVDLSYDSEYTYIITLVAGTKSQECSGGFVTLPETSCIAPGNVQAVVS